MRQHLPRVCILLLLSCYACLSQASPPAQKADANYIGAQQCQTCHAAEFASWQHSDHDLAMQEATAESVLGDFDNASFSHGGLAHRFFKRGGQFWVNTDGPDGKLQDFRVEYVFGHTPLQQYLLALPGGRLQALGIAWDSRPATQGGHRWFHLQPEEQPGADNPLHWTGPYYNWNGRCAECHSTNLQKNFDSQSTQYATTWTEINVACEACHGPGRQHAELARTNALDSQPNGGLVLALAERGQWGFAPGEPIAQRQQALTDARQIDSCGRCHSRRGTLGEYHYGRPLLDTHRLSLLDEQLYYPDGQIQDEVYVYGSFVQSRMHAAGVVCSNCHEPHSLQLRAPGNDVCAQCHQPARYDTSEHHHHPANSAGASCANCHMPETTYMGVDPRRDHSLRIPRPDLSVVIGTPNACNQCHQDHNAEWALDALRRWGVEFADTGSHRARTLAQARSGDARAVPGLEELARDVDNPPIWRATAMVALGGFARQQSYQTALLLLRDSDPLLRMAAVRSLEFLPQQQLFAVLEPHLADPVTAVRVEIARALSAVPLEQLEQRRAAQLRVLFDEYLLSLDSVADMPETQLQLGAFFTARGSWQAAELAYQRALQLNPQYVLALLNLADLYRGLEREAQARQLLLQAAAIAPEQGTPLHALGLLETRTGNREQALAYLRNAAALEREGTRHRYVYAVALNDSGDRDAAIALLRTLLRAAPEDPDILLALVTYCQQAKRLPEAKRYAARLLKLAPNDAGIRQLYDSL